MKVAWIAHHHIYAPEGGAEFTDREMIERRPEGVEIDVVHPSNFDRLDGYDRVVVSRPELIPAAGAGVIAATRPVFFSHGDVLPRAPHIAHVVQRSRPFIAQTPLSMEHIERWAGPLEHAETMVPYMDLEGVHVAEKEDFALWPHRNIWHKGKDLAVEWAHENGVDIRFMSGRPRSEVLEVMARARWVVLLSKILDGCPRSIREAQLSGCELVVNELVGYWDIPADELRERTLAAPKRFWEIVQT